MCSALTSVGHVHRAAQLPREPVTTWGHAGKDGGILFSLVRGIIITKCAFGKKFQAFLTPGLPVLGNPHTLSSSWLVLTKNICVRGGPEHGKGLRCLVFNEKQKRLDCSKAFNY